MQPVTAFRRAEKLYKRRSQPLDVETAIDFRKIVGSNEAAGSATAAAVQRIHLTNDLESPTAIPFPVYRDKRPPAYALRNHPGLIVIPNPLADEAQRWVARKCLCDCMRPPNRTNMDPFFEMPDDSVFTLSTQNQGSINNRFPKDTLQFGVTPSNTSFYRHPTTAAELMSRIRWCTLGQQYNWTTKEYDLGSAPFDPELDTLMVSIAKAITDPTTIDPNIVVNDYDGTQFVSQAGIINFYDERATMAGHVDRTEEKMDAPLISLSIGLDCIYLVGGPTRESEPVTALILHSGDILAMCGPSRNAVHGVPRVIVGTTPDCLKDSSAGDNDAVADMYPSWSHFAQYLERYRVNCNARKCS